MKQPQRISNKDYFTSVGFGLLSALVLSVASAFGKQLTIAASLNAIVFIRFFAPFVLVSIIYFLICDKGNIKLNFKVNFIRAIFTVIGQYCFFFLLNRGSLLLAILLYSTNALFMPFLARNILKAEIKIKTLIAVVIGFIGITITLGPIKNILTIDTLIGLTAGFSLACSQISFHYVSKKQDPITINFISYGLCSLLTLILLIITIPYATIIRPNFLFGWQGIILILSFSIFAIANQIVRSLAYKRINKASTLAPFLYCSLIFSVILDWLWWGVIPTWHNYVGIAIILTSGIIMSIRNVKVQPI